MRYGLVHSRNLMTIRIAQDIGMDKIAGYADRFGAYDHLQPYLANSIGSQVTTLYRMVSSYAMFANGGERVDPTLVDRVQDRYGRTIYRHDQRDCVSCNEARLPPGHGLDIVSHRERVLNAITAYELTSMLEGVVQHGTAAGVVNLPVPVAGKTGTTDNAKSVWFIGFTSNIVAGCYMGFDTPRTLGKGAFGGSLCAPIFQDFMTQVIKKYGGGPFKVPPGGYFINIDRNTGARLPDNAMGDNVVAEYFRDGEVPVFGVDGLVTGGFADGLRASAIRADRRQPDRPGPDGDDLERRPGDRAEYQGEFRHAELGRALLGGTGLAARAARVFPRCVAHLPLGHAAPGRTPRRSNPDIW